ncbi:hypothetical protein SUDANB171_01468 [Streptomyces sp. enrichment culture]
MPPQQSLRPSPSVPPPPSAQVTAAEISRIAGVTRATVSNWRRRHDDFPDPGGGTENSPLYDLAAVREWLRKRGQTWEASPAEELRTALRLYPAGIGIRLFPLLSVAARCAPGELARYAASPDDESSPRSRDGAGSAPSFAYHVEDTSAVRALLRYLTAAGPQAALEVLAERELEESAAPGTYPTPEDLAGLMAAFLPADTATVLDPACGSGTLLLAAAQRGARGLYGQDALAVQSQRSALRILLADPEAEPQATVTTETGDSLRADAFPGLTVDAVLCNPPFGDRDWGHDELAYDPRWAYGVPPRSESELAWMQHALAHTRPGGHAVLLLPPALASRPSGRRIRAELVRTGALRAVVSLPAGAAQPRHIGLHLWVLQRPEPDGPERSSVLFITGEGDRPDTSSGSRPSRVTLDWPGLTARVMDQWTAFTNHAETFADAPGTARAVPAINLLDDTVDVTPARHVRVTAAEITPEAMSRRVTDLHARLTEELNGLTAAANSARPGEWQAPKEPAHGWRTATVADLARGGALALVRAAVPIPGEASDGPVLTAADVSTGSPPSGTTDATTHVLAAGDVVLCGDASHSTRGAMTRVADERDAGSLLGPHLHILRPDPSRLDPWFLAGFLGADDNITAATTGSSVVHVNPGRLRVPLLPLAEQQRYGQAFRRVHALRLAARRTADAAADAATKLTAGLTSGTIKPSAAADPPPRQQPD